MKVNMAAPAPYFCMFFLLCFLPYLYPMNYFVYERVFSFFNHFLFVGLLACVIGFAYISAGQIKAERLNIKVVNVKKDFYQISLFFIYLSILFNALIVGNGLISFTGNVFSSKASLEDFGGVNIISQLYVFFVPAVVIYAVQRGGKFPRNILILLGFILFLRAIIMSERVAFVEFVIPVAITYLIASRSKIQLGTLLKALFVFLLFFIVLELTRQFYVQYIEGGRGVDAYFAISWTVERLFAYYADTMNKLYYALSNGLGFTSNNYATGLLRMFDRIISGTQVQAQGVDYGRFRWADFTNPGGMTQLYMDFSYLGLALLFFVFFVFKRLYINATGGGLFSICIYPTYVTGVFELPRFVTAYNTRTLFPLFVFLFVYFFYALIKRRRFSYVASRKL